MNARNFLLTVCTPLVLLVGAPLFVAACSNASGGSGAAPAGASCTTPTDCGPGQTCTGNICVTKQTCDEAAGKKCPTGYKCNAGSCVALTAADAGGGDGNVADAGGGTDPDAVTGGQSDGTGGGDDVATPGLGNACKPCKLETAEADCGGGEFQCITLLNGNFCARKCTASSECPAAFKCDKADTKAANSNCLPPQYQCDKCLVSGCPSGQSCVATTGQCAVVKQQCGECNAQTDCADGLKCVKLGAVKVCAPACENGAACPEKSDCQNTVVGKVCAFQDATCCYGPQCKVADACAACPTKCFGGACVGCLKDTDCPNGKCDANSHTCITSGGCSAPTPIKLADGKCVECTNDTHCNGSKVGTKCDLSNHTCAAATATNECKACVDPYPGCVQLNGTWSCVECTTDGDCAAKSKGTCSGTTYTCSGTVGTGTGQLTGTCKSDSDCTNAGTTTFTLMCDTGSGLCYDTAGKCDNVSAFCNAKAGSSCVQPSSVGGLPGLPGGTGANPGEGVCSCAAGGGSTGGGTANPICKLLAPTCDCAVDPNSAACTSSPFGPCCGGSSGGGGGLPFDLSCLQPSPNAPDCFGGLSCTCDLFSSISGGGGGGGAVPHNCGTGSGGFPGTP